MPVLLQGFGHELTVRPVQLIEANVVLLHGFEHEITVHLMTRVDVSKVASVLRLSPIPDQTVTGCGPTPVAGPTPVGKTSDPWLTKPRGREGGKRVFRDFFITASKNRGGATGAPRNKKPKQKQKREKTHTPPTPEKPSTPTQNFRGRGGFRRGTRKGRGWH